MKKLLSILIVSIICLLLSNTAFASSLETNQINEHSSDTLFSSLVYNTLNQLKRNQNRMTRDYKSLNFYLNNRDSIIISSLGKSNSKISNIEDTISVLNLNLKNVVSEITSIQTRLYKQSNIFLIILSTLVFLVLLLLIYNIRKANQFTQILSHLISIDRVKDASSNNSISQCNEKLELLKRGQNDILSKIKTLSVDHINIKEFNSLNSEKINQLVKSLNEISSSLCSLSSVSATTVSTINLNRPDKVAYDAAVDAWININNHLASLGKDRKKIQHVYALLAGHYVDEAEVSADLSMLDEERKEEVNIIISDIKRFMAQHLNAIESWLSFDTGSLMTLKDAVRFPLGVGFNSDLDEELTGDIVNDGETISMVASLGYLFPGSRNGCYREKSKVLV